ncbi:uncharacterized protein J3D65DRAFT_664489 [Phyllosticta citribraziliensis]|uniref:Uncharacterized protein n=1 Tax=Phyllosticta citribraziliensis TaxID=989973 RepID=A0ABR1M3A5_9PEZI
MAHYFAQPMKPTQSLRARRHAPPRKRQRLDDHDSDGDSDNQDSDKGRDPSPESSTRATPAISTLSAADARQFRTAGHDPDFELPLDPFPHAPTNVTAPKLFSSEIQQKLANLKPPLFAPGLSRSARITEDFTQRTTSFRQHHLGVLTTVMHHCLLKGDYQRAGRAWGMILRGESRNMTLDIRKHARWAIGAEVLLRANRVDDDSNQSVESPRHEIFSEQGFQAARDYYERIIVQYPFQQSAPHVTNALTFYPAMFSLWIYQVSQEASLAKEELENEDLDQSDHDSEIESRSEDGFARQSRKREAKLAAIRVNELRKAQEIASRLDELMTSPPYDKDVDLLQLRGMTAVWISDLLRDGLAGDDDENASNHDVSLPGQGMERDETARQEQVAIAKTMFTSVKSNGGHLKEAAEQFLADAES